jgi:hypothetical protein
MTVTLPGFEEAAAGKNPHEGEDAISKGPTMERNWAGEPALTKVCQLYSWLWVLMRLPDDEMVTFSDGAERCIKQRTSRCIAARNVWLDQRG